MDDRNDTSMTKGNRGEKTNIHLEKYPTQILPHVIALQNRQKELDLSSILCLQPQLQLQYWLDEVIIDQD